MRYILTVASLAAVAVLAALWAAGDFDELALWAAEQQRAFQNGIARSLRSLRAGEPGAMAALVTACFAYGLAHAAGPGHGKVLIGGYGIAQRVPMLRLSVIAFLASLGQAVTAIAVVYVGLLIFGAGRAVLVGTVEGWMAPASYGAIALIGCWLAYRGLRKLIRQRKDQHAHLDDHVCSSCGHAHGPTVEEVQQTRSLRDAFLLIGGIAIRPCTGALFVLILTWQMGIWSVGIIGAFAMATGTAVVTVLVGLTAGGLRGGVLAGFVGSPAMARTMAGLEVLAGSFVVLIASGLLLRAI